MLWFADIRGHGDAGEAMCYILQRAFSDGVGMALRIFNEAVHYSEGVDRGSKIALEQTYLHHEAFISPPTSENVIPLPAE